MDIYTIIFLALAVFIFLRLRNVLGQKTGSERPYDRVNRDVARPADSRGTNDNVVPLPGTVIDQAPVSATTSEAAPADRWKGIAEPGSALAAGLDAVSAQDPSFDSRHFLTGARSAYEMIVNAFAAGDRKALKDLLTRDVYDGFDAAIAAREQSGHKVDTRFVSIDKADFVAAEVRDRAAHLTVRFVSQMITVTRDKSGAVIDGSPEKVTDVTDIWTFARDLASRDPNWKLERTESVD
ncbi:MAG TPA: Tim44/TimA family putative adaptor protein [Xanthobacteraceae bacterium]|nr:Tim44/TimA family putative adaptor protein [Xanthobacteraceae bacterium]